MTEQETCPVCFEDVRSDGDDAMRCANRHKTCLRCAAKMVKPCGRDCKPQTCTGLWFTCPLCSERYSVSPPFLLAMFQRSWAKSHSLHESDDHQAEGVSERAVAPDRARRRGRVEAGRVLWVPAVMCEQRLLWVAMLWAACCGRPAVGSLLWAACCGQPAVGSGRMAASFSVMPSRHSKCRW